jgi:DNA-directed RNA polymerase specialized sigma24 family protein
MTEKDIRQALIQLQRLMMSRRGGVNCIDQQEIDKIEQNVQRLYAHFVLDFRRTAKNKGLTNEEFDDVYQQTFSRIVQHILTYREEFGGSGWIATIFHHCLADFLKSQRRQSTREEEMKDTNVPLSGTTNEMADPPSILIEKERRTALNRAWQDTPQAEKEDLCKRGRGPGRRAWQLAARRFLERFQQHYNPDEFDTE